MPKATNTHAQYVILIVLPLQQWLHERPSMLRYTYIACLFDNWAGKRLLRGTNITLNNKTAYALDLKS